MTSRQPVTGRHHRRRLAFGAAAALLLFGGCSRPPTEIVLDVRLQPDGSAMIAVTGPPGRQVAVVADRPRRADAAMFAGLAGMRCAPEPEAADLATGAGQQLIGVLGDEPLQTTLPPARLRSLPQPGVFQAIAVDQSQGFNRLALSNAFHFERGPAGPTVTPFTAAHGLAAARATLLSCIALPLLLVVALRSLWRGAAPRWLLPLLAIAAIAVRAVGGAGIWTVAAWPPPDELTALERHYGPGLVELMTTLRAERRPHEPLTVLVAADHVPDQQSLAAHLVRLLPGTTVVTQPAPLPTAGLAIVLATTALAKTAVVPHTPPGRVLCTTRIAVLWRLGAS